MATGSFHSLGETTKWGEVSTPTSRSKQLCVLVMGVFAQQQDREPTCPRRVLCGACQRSGLVIFQTLRLSVSVLRQHLQTQCQPGGSHCQPQELMGMATSWWGTKPQAPDHTSWVSDRPGLRCCVVLGRPWPLPGIQTSSYAPPTPGTDGAEEGASWAKKWRDLAWDQS